MVYELFFELNTIVLNTIVLNTVPLRGCNYKNSVIRIFVNVFFKLKFRTIKSAFKKAEKPTRKILR
jgi:hypothetical protein